eukprot:TRINITY_DN12030_c0_g1_i1.p1 TRINITY_DN12030_c0_g1~~TRINITY_DN12030_c0_g1_i1.p1  ORF type:complete len:253 (+),score=49.69 TRINITY_DN12030_c0_g1_i1:46-804(+)
MSVTLHLRVEGEAAGTRVVVEMEGKESVGDLASKAALACDLKKQTFELQHDGEILKNSSLRVNEICFKDGDEVVVVPDEKEHAMQQLRNMGLQPDFNYLRRTVLRLYDEEESEDSSDEEDYEGPLDDVLQLYMKAIPALLEQRTHGKTLLHLCYRPDLASLLISYGADVNAVTQNDLKHTHLHRCCNSAAMVPILIEAGAGVNARDCRGRTPMHTSYCTDVIELLLDAGADMQARDNEGLTPSDTQADDIHF